MLTFDVEEYFHVEAAREGLQPHKWEAIQPRLMPWVERILAMLAEDSQKATFFVLGWVARRHGALVKLIAAAGHEVASHGMSHRMIERMEPKEFRAS